MKKTRVEQCEVNVFAIDSIGDASTVVDTCDESRSRLQTVKLQQDVRITVASTNFGDANADTGTDASNESKNRMYRSTLTVMCGSTQQAPDANTEDTHSQLDTNDNSRSRRQENGEVVQTPGSGVGNYGEESRSRCNRCSMSTDQHLQQPVTSVVQGRNIEPTVVNMHDIDKCLATNKHEPPKQHSIQMGNQWLFSTLSRFTSSVLGKSTNKIREEFVENINANGNSNLNLKPEFNFFL